MSYLTLSDTAYSGERSVCVENVEENDARFEQTVAVQPNAWYLISCMARVEGGQEGGVGASVSVKDTFVYSEPVYDTNGEWVRLTLYGKTTADQKSITVMCRVGGYGSLETGRAWFDDVSVTRVDGVPDGETGHSLELQMGVSSSGDASDEETAQRSSFAALLLLSVLFAAACALSYALCRRRGDDPKAARVVLGTALAAGLIVRVALAVSVRGFGVDMNCFEGWAERIFRNGFHFYDDWCDYPPGYILLLWPIGALRVLLNIGYDTPAQLAAHQGDSDRLRCADRAAAGRYVPQKAGAAGRFVAGRGLFYQSRRDLQRRRVGTGGLRAVAAAASGHVLCGVAPLEERAVGVRLRHTDQAAGADVCAHRPSGADLRNRRRA